jgi:2-polyprenyl-3-methyl-5-hydroxy-6-metoxy-1,4-benzoquinol methylase
MLTRSSCFNEKWAYECNAPVISVSATPNCSLISATSVGRSLYLFSSDGNLIWETSSEGLDHEGWSTAISADGSVIAVGTANKNPADGTIYVFNAHGDQIFSDNVGSPVWALSFSSDGKVLVGSSWDGRAYKYVRNSASYKRYAALDLQTPQGLYGIKLNRLGTQTYVCAYDSAVIQLDEKWKEVERYDNKNGSYNIAIAEETKTGFVGLRNGEILRFKIGQNKVNKLKIEGCARPICGIASSKEGELLVGGSFDGWVYLLRNDGTVLGRLETNGEVWSVACSDDATRICIGSGDKTVRFLENHCNATSIREIGEFESACKRSEDIDNALQRLVRGYAEFGLYEYGYNRLKYLQSQRNDFESIIFERQSIDLLNYAVKYSTQSHWAHFELGLIAKNKNRHRDAIYHFQRAANDPCYGVRAMILCAESFAAKRLSTATSSCYRRARGQQLDSDAKRILYNLGRSYEDSKHLHGAYSHYQLLASWDINYRNVWERLEHIIDIHGFSKSETTPPRIDYTGLTTSFLGPDAPLDVDSSLQEVLRARTSEILIQPGERNKISEIIRKLRDNARFSRGITGTGLDYDQELFLKYDYALPEDETKKFLETVNLLYLLKETDLANKSTLDIGSATGRYPMLMRWLGAQSYGMDIEPRAIEYANRQKESEEEFPKYFNADATKTFPSDIPKVNLVTCMMGTFAHINNKEQETVINLIYDCLVKDGFLAISTWDLECSHLSYLSIYNEVQKDTIRRNSPSTARMQEMLTKAGFREIQIRPFVMLPQVIVYDLGIENLRSGDIELAAQADLAVRALYPQKHGEMFIAFGVK